MISHVNVLTGKQAQPQAVADFPALSNQHECWIAFRMFAPKSEHIIGQVNNVFRAHISPESAISQHPSQFDIDTNVACYALGTACESTPSLHMRVTAKDVIKPFKLLNQLVQEGLVSKQEADEIFLPLIQRALLESCVLSIDRYLTHTCGAGGSNGTPYFPPCLPVNLYVELVEKQIQHGLANTNTIHNLLAAGIIDEKQSETLIDKLKLYEAATYRIVADEEGRKNWALGESRETPGSNLNKDVYLYYSGNARY